MDKEFLAVLKLPPVRIAPFFAAGIILCAAVDQPWLLMLSAVIAAVAVFLLYRKAFISAVALLLGMLSITCYITLICEPILASDGTTQILTCRITDVQDYGGYAYYRCDTEINGRVTGLTFYSGNYLRVGDIVTAEVSFKENDSPVALARKILLSGTVKRIIDREKPEFDLSRMLFEYRRNLSNDIASFIDHDDTSALSRGMLFGDTGSFSAGLRHAAQVSGIMHFTAVSGSHFVIIMTVMLGFISEKRKKLRAVISAIIIPLAVMFYGAEPSVLRAGIMLFLCNCSALFGRRAETLNSLCVAVLIMTAFTPYVMLDVGFQMSVMGVLGVSVLGKYAVKAASPLLRRTPWAIKAMINAIIVSSCATICIAPISAEVFGGVSLIGAFTTLVLTPVFTMAMAFAIFYALTGFTTALASLALLMKACCQIIKLFGSQSRLWLVMDFEYAGALALCSLIVLTVAVLFPKHVLKQGTFVFGVTAVLAFGLSFGSSLNRRKVDFVSSGKSGAAVVCIKDEARVLISGSGDNIDIPLADCLLENGIYKLRYIVAPQLEDSGVSEMSDLYKLYPVDNITFADEYCVESLSKKCPGLTITVDDMNELEVDGISISCAKAGDTDNNADIVMYYGYKMSEPKYGAALPLYVSSRQNIIPENGINIFDTDLEIKLN